jgi:hypothetical protein
MAVPSTNIGLSNIYWEAQFGGGSGNPGYSIPFETVAGDSYFEGPNGNSTNSYNGWGQNGNTSGANRIYNLNAISSNYSFNNFASKVYFYDQSSYACILNVNNNLGPSTFFPPPPIDNTVQDVNLTLRDSSNTYSYIVAGTGAIISAGDGGSPVSIDASSPSSPLIRTAYWTITIGANLNFPGATADLTVNGTSIFTGQAVNAGPASTSFDFNTWGSVVMAASYGGTVAGFYFDLTIY